MNITGPTELESKIIDYWHCSKGACGYGASRTDRMAYVKKWLLKDNEELIKGFTIKQLWQEIEDVTSPTN